jgi:hypothetical protein
MIYTLCYRLVFVHISQFLFQFATLFLSVKRWERHTLLHFWSVRQLVRIANVYGFRAGYIIFNQINNPLIPPMDTIPKITNSNILINLFCLS